MPASLRSDYPVIHLLATGPFSPVRGVTFTGIRIIAAGGKPPLIPVLQLKFPGYSKPLPIK